MEAPEVEQFAREHAEVVTVVGLGTQDSFEEAQGFVSQTGTTFTMLWDPSFESWRALGILGQPAAILLDRQGRQLGDWFGRFDQDRVVELAGAA
ncbi:MAG: TlpA disulfide reductase family protein [Actinomycetota bacterium]